MEEQSVIVSSDKIMLWALDGNHIPFREGAPEMHHDPPPNAITFHSLAWNKKDELQFYSTDNYKPHRYIKFFLLFFTFRLPIRQPLSKRYKQLQIYGFLNISSKMASLAKTC